MKKPVLAENLFIRPGSHLMYFGGMLFHYRKLKVNFTHICSLVRSVTVLALIEA